MKSVVVEHQQVNEECSVLRLEGEYYRWTWEMELVTGQKR